MFERFLDYFLPLNPFNRTFGYSSGSPIDRYFIEKFLKENGPRIKGTTLEVAEKTYTQKFGSAVERSLTLGVAKDANYDIVCDLEKGSDKSNFLDCFILTQTLPFVFDPMAVLRNSYNMLNEGGTLLVTVPGITQISRYDYDRWGQYWAFTAQSLTKIIQQSCPKAEFRVDSFGNARLAASFLYGVPVEKISKKTLEYVDLDYQLVITARITKGQLGNAKKDN